MADRPGREIEARASRSSPRSERRATTTTRTFWAGSSFCTPSATTCRPPRRRRRSPRTSRLVGARPRPASATARRRRRRRQSDGPAALVEQRRQRQPRHARRCPARPASASRSCRATRRRRPRAARSWRCRCGSRDRRSGEISRSLARVASGPASDHSDSVAAPLLARADQRFRDGDHGLLLASAGDADRGLAGGHDLAGLDQASR